MTSKLYLHYDGPPQYTKILRVEVDTVLSPHELLHRFAEFYNDRHPGHTTLDARHLRLETAAGRNITFDTTIRATKDLPNDFSVYKTVSRQSSLDGPPFRPNGDAKSPKAPSKGGEQAFTPQSKSIAAAPLNDLQPAILAPFLEKGKDAESRQQYRMAATIYEQVLKRAPSNHEVLIRLTRLWKMVGRPDKALIWAEQALQIYSKDPQLREHLADCLRSLNRNLEAWKAYEKAIALSKETNCRDVLLSAKVSMATMLYGMEGHCREFAIVTILKVLEDEPGCPRALMQLAIIKKDKGELQNATRLFIQLLIRDQDNTQLKLQLAQCLKQQEGRVDWVKSLPEREMRGAALAFLATSVKDHGALPTCIQLFKMALECCPNNPAYVLNLLHAHELEQDYSSAVQAAVQFCRLTSLTLCEEFEFGTMADSFSCLPHLPKGCSREWREFEAWNPTLHPAQSDPTLTSASSSANFLSNPDKQTAGVIQQIQYNAEALDSLAVLMTVVKVLYLGGAIKRASLLVDLIEPARLASSKPLHTTLIRNEAAYFSCIAQLLRQFPPPSTPHNARPLYLCGDSHALSGAWHTLRYKDELRLLVPLLVTGCKIWHLRKAGRFFPKMAWLSTLEALQDGSQLIFMFGEIDCREGLLLAVEKLKYDTLEEAMAVLIEIYTETLLDLIQTRGFEIYVHPVPSVLNETRHVVRPFNKALQIKVQELEKDPKAEGKVHWLDLFEDLLTPDGLRMKPHLQLDGTHMNPYFVEFIEKALSACI